MSTGKSPSNTTAETKEGNPRPFPEPARRKKDAHKTRIYALLVGINDYEGDINPLDGCVRDVNNVANYLREQYGDENSAAVADLAADASVDKTEIHQRLFLRTLTNKEATYANVISAFEEHLVKGKLGEDTVNVPTGDDTFWFHFSGHGSEQFTASELISRVPNGKDQTLVCYNTDEATSGIFLADKELAIMVDRINSMVITKKKRPHIVITLDACHTGSGTRDAFSEPGVTTRNYKFLPSKKRDDDGISTDHIRTLASYYNGWYSKRSSLNIPQSSHLLMAACNNLEKAGDLGLTEGGVFTSSLIEVLGEFGTEDKPYVELFERVRSRARSKRKVQHAQFEPIGNFNPYTSFLDGYRVEDKGKRYQLTPRGGNWFIDCGVLHGLPAKMDLAAADAEASAPTEKTKIEIFLGDKSLGFAEVEDVGIQDSKINIKNLDDGVVLKTKIASTEEGILEAAEAYYGVIFSLPAPAEYVWVHGDDALVEELLSKWNEEEEENDLQLSNLNIIATTNREEGGKDPVLEVEATLEGTENQTRRLTFRNLETDLEWTNIRDDKTREFIPVAKDNIDKIIKWHRFYDLDNQKSKLRDEFALVFKETDEVTWSSEEIGSPHPSTNDFINTMRSHTGSEIKLYRSKASFFQQKKDDQPVDAIPYHIYLKHKAVGTDLFFYLYEFEADGSITLLNKNGTHLEGAEAGKTHSDSLDTETPLIAGLRRITMKVANAQIKQVDQQEEHLWYKLLVTRKELKNPIQLNQLPFRNTKDTDSFFSTESTIDLQDWCSYNMKVVIVRQQDKVSSGHEVIFPDSIVTIQPHEKVTAQASLLGLTGGTRSADPANHLARFTSADVSLLDLSEKSATRSTRSKHVIELTGMEGSSDIDLEKDPLKIRVKQKLKEGEVIMPVAFDGEFIRFVGDATAVTNADGEDEIEIRIKNFPKVAPVMDESGERVVSPFGPESADRSPFRALKFAFFKWSSSDEEDIQKKEEAEESFFKLSWVDFKKDGTIKRKQTSLKAAVSQATNVLLVIHGIIGDTKVIAENLPRIADADGKSMAKHYDLVLTFDYENLDTSIADIARKLKSDLADAGINAAWGKHLTIMAHSMGGLVSRHLIEKEEGATFVKHLIMVGTPNAGSPFGDVPSWLGFATSALEVAANFMPTNIRSFGQLLQGVGKKVPTKGMNLFQTLEEMRTTSNFLQQLNDPAVGAPDVRYSIIAGDADEFKITEGGRFQRFLEKSKVKVGKWMNDGEKHDIAVSLESILNERLDKVPKMSVWTARNQVIAEKDKQIIPCHHLNYFVTNVGRKAIAKAALD